MTNPIDRGSNSNRQATPRKLISATEVASTFSVHPGTVVRWAKEGKISHIKTLGGHRRYDADEIHKMVNPNG